MKEFEFPKSINGERIKLKKMTHGYDEAFFNLIMSDKKRIGQFLSKYSEIHSIDDIRGFIDKDIKKWKNKTDFNYAMIDKFSGEFMGRVGIINIEWRHESVEIGALVGKDYEGMGYVSEFIRLAEKIVFSYNFHRIKTACSDGNIRSCSMIEKNGYVFEGVMRESYRVVDQFHNMRVYSKLISEYKE